MKIQCSRWRLCLVLQLQLQLLLQLLTARTAAAGIAALPGLQGLQWPGRYAGMQEQEINLKLRILVPRNTQPGVPGGLGILGQPQAPAQVRPVIQLLPPQTQMVTAGAGPVPHVPGLPVVNNLGIGSLSSHNPLRTSVLMPPEPALLPGTSVVQSLFPEVPSVPYAMVSKYVAPRPVGPLSYLKIPLRSPYSSYAPALSYTAYAPPGNFAYLPKYSPWPAPAPAVRPITQTQSYTGKYGLLYNYAGPSPPPRLNVTVDQVPVLTPPQPQAPLRPCDLNVTAAEPEEDGGEDAADDTVLEKDAEYLPSPLPSPHSWLGYIPEDILEHAKKSVTNGKVNVEKNVDKIHFRQKWKNSNYPKSKQPQNVPGVGEDLWKALKGDLQEMAKLNQQAEEEEDDDDRDPDFEEPKGDAFEEGRHLDDYELRQDDDSGRPQFVDFWGNRVPKYVNGFMDPQETAQDARSEYNKDPNGWNPAYVKGLWSDDDNHLQTFSGKQGEKSGDKPEYDNGMGESLAQNYNKYVANNGTWVGPTAQVVPNNLQDILKNSVSYEAPVQNPHEKYATYADVIRYLNSKKYPQAPTPARQQTRARPVPWPVLRLVPAPAPVTPSPPPPPAPTPAAARNRNLVDVNQLVEALILHKEKERAIKQGQAVPVSVNAEQDADDGEEYEDDEDEEEPAAGAAVNESVQVSNAHSSPPAATQPPQKLCKGIRDVGVTKDGSEMAHMQGVVCVNNYDFAENGGVTENTGEGSAER